MTTRNRFWIFVTIFAIAATSFAARRFNDIPVNSSLSDYDGNGVLYYLQSDTRGTYQNGTDAVKSVLMENGYSGIPYGDLRLDLQASPLRTISLTFSSSNALQPGDPGYTAPAQPPWWGTQNNAAAMEAACTFIGLDMHAMNTGDHFTCPMWISLSSLDSSSNYYRLMMGFNSEPETHQVQISCNSTDSAGCKDWYLDPIPIIDENGNSIPGRTLARLNYIVRRGKESGTTNMGDFYLTFHIHVTRP